MSITLFNSATMCIVLEIRIIYGVSGNNSSLVSHFHFNALFELLH